MNYTNKQLKLALAKMLPELLDTEPLEAGDIPDTPLVLVWKQKQKHFPEHWTHTVLDTELLHLCHLVEETMEPGMLSHASSDWSKYVMTLGDITWRTKQSNIHATWQQRIQALATVKGIEI